MRDRDSEEDRGLLQEDETETKSPPPHTHRSNSAATFRTWLAGSSRWTIIGIVVLVSVFALPLLGFLGRGASPSVASHHSESDQLAIRLHPDKHAARAPTTLTLDWNITRGVRAPDGVEKPVYLVNGSIHPYMSCALFTNRLQVRSRDQPSKPGLATDLSSTSSMASIQKACQSTGMASA